MMNKKTAQWISLTNEVLENFLYNYFDDNNPYYFWVGDEIGGVVCYGGFFFRFLDVIACNKLKVSRPQFLNWYFHNLKNKSSISLEEFITSPEKQKEHQKRHLSELKERVILAEEEFNKAIKDYKK